MIAVARATTVGCLCQQIHVDGFDSMLLTPTAFFSSLFFSSTVTRFFSISIMPDNEETHDSAEFLAMPTRTQSIRGRGVENVTRIVEKMARAHQLAEILPVSQTIRTRIHTVAQLLQRLLHSQQQIDQFVEQEEEELSEEPHLVEEAGEDAVLLAAQREQLLALQQESLLSRLYHGVLCRALGLYIPNPLWLAEARVNTMSAQEVLDEASRIEEVKRRCDEMSDLMKELLKIQRSDEPEDSDRQQQLLQQLLEDEKDLFLDDMGPHFVGFHSMEPSRLRLWINGTTQNQHRMLFGESPPPVAISQQQHAPAA